MKKRIEHPKLKKNSWLTLTNLAYPMYTAKYFDDGSIMTTVIKMKTMNLIIVTMMVKLL